MMGTWCRKHRQLSQLAYWLPASLLSCSSVNVNTQVYVQFQKHLVCGMGKQEKLSFLCAVSPANRCSQNTENEYEIKEAQKLFLESCTVPLI